jgi:hypothetical protein
MTKSIDMYTASRQVINKPTLEAMGYLSVDDMLRQQAAESGHTFTDTGYGTSTLHVGLTEAGREAFRAARQEAIADLYPELDN